MFPPRKDKSSDETESKLDFAVENLVQLKDANEALPKHIERGFEEQTHLLGNVVRESTELLNNDLKNGFRADLQVVGDRLLKGQKEAHSLTLQELRQMCQQFTTQYDELLAQIQLIATAQNELKTQFDAQKAQRRNADTFEIRSETPQALAQWCKAILARYGEFKDHSGMIGVVAKQGLKQFNALRAIVETFDEAEMQHWIEWLEDLEHWIFVPEVRTTCSELTAANSTTTQRKTLRSLENATGELRAYVREELRSRTGIAAIEIVPYETKFDANQHESSDFLEVPTTEAQNHNLILAVERPGFEQVLDGQRRILRVARVRRYVFRSAAPQTLVSPTLAAQSVTPSPTATIDPAQEVDNLAPVAPALEKETNSTVPGQDESSSSETASVDIQPINSLMSPTSRRVTGDL